jgi:hypothetical protein
MDKVKRLVKAGATITGAIQDVLRQQGFPTVTAFADRYHRDRSNMTRVILGTRAPAQADVDALIAELGGTDLEWRQLLHEAGRPINTKAAV